MLELHQTECLGRDEIGVSARTVSRILTQHGVLPLRALDPITVEVIRVSETTAIRYERDLPGEPVHVDGKKLGKTPWQPRVEAYGHASESIQRDRRMKAGFDYIHSLVDDHARLGVFGGPPR